MTCRGLGLLLSLALLGGACTVQTEGAFVAEAEVPGADTSQRVVPYVGPVFEHGVTREPCPDAVNPDNGCITLGAIVTRTGPYAELGPAALAGAQAFWEHVNEEGGVFGRSRHGIEARFDVDLTTHVADNGSEVEVHIDELEQMRPEILALGLSQGTATNVAALHHYKEHDLVTVPLDWWSGWPFEPIVADTGMPYCLQTLSGLDYVLELLGGGTPFGHVMVVHEPDRHGQDAVAATEHFAERHEIPWHRTHHAVPVHEDGGVGHAVETIEEVRPEAIVAAIPPATLAELASELARIDWAGYIVATAPSFVPGAVADGRAADLLRRSLVRVDPYPPLDHEAKAYHHMREHLGGEEPDNHFWIAGWMNQYPLLEAIKHAIEHGDLTRAGLVHAVEEVVVKYEESLRRRTYTGDVTHNVPRNAWLYTPDPDATLGERLVEPAHTGTLAGRFDLTRPCSEQ